VIFCMKAFSHLSRQQILLSKHSCLRYHYFANNQLDAVSDAAASFHSFWASLVSVCPRLYLSQRDLCCSKVPFSHGSSNPHLPDSALSFPVLLNAHSSPQILTSLCSCQLQGPLPPSDDFLSCFLYSAILFVVL
jgi:hypothetical protein